MQQRLARNDLINHTLRMEKACLFKSVLIGCSLRSGVLKRCNGEPLFDRLRGLFSTEPAGVLVQADLKGVLHLEKKNDTLLQRQELHSISSKIGENDLCTYMSKG